MNAHTPQRARARSYAGKVAIRHLMEVARDLGLDIVGIEVSPDGTIRVLDRRAVAEKQTLTDFDRLEAEL